MFDSSSTKVLPCVAAGTPVNTAEFSGGDIWVYPAAAGTYTVEQAPASADDICIASDEWTPLQKYENPCADKMDLVDVSVEITEEDIGRCFILVKCTDQFVRFSGDVAVVGNAASNRPPIAYGCGPTVVV